MRFIKLYKPSVVSSFLEVVCLAAAGLTRVCLWMEGILFTFLTAAIRIWGEVIITKYKLQKEATQRVFIRKLFMPQIPSFVFLLSHSGWVIFFRHDLHYTARLQATNNHYMVNCRTKRRLVIFHYLFIYWNHRTGHYVCLAFKIVCDYNIVLEFRPAIKIQSPGTHECN